MASPNALDRLILAVAPRAGAKRLLARRAAEFLTRNYEAAKPWSRTANWVRTQADANVSAGAALSTLRALSHDLVRNNPWAQNAIGIIQNNTVGTGILAKALGLAADAPFQAAWKTWANSTQCDADGRLTFSGLQSLAMRTVVESGEVLIRRRWRRPEDGLALPMQLQVLEPDLIDTSIDNRTGIEGGQIIQGVEFDALGRRVAYWLFTEHPGSGRTGFARSSRRVTASDLIHVYRVDRPGQVRGVPWLCTAILRLKDFDEFEDAQLMRQKIAAMFAAIFTDAEGETPALGVVDPTSPPPPDAQVQTLEPGTILTGPPGRDVKFANPPLVTDDGFSARALRGVAAGLQITYEDMTGDYSGFNYSSSRQSQKRHHQAVEHWRWNMLIPHACDGTWAWAAGAATLAGLLKAPVGVEWTPPPVAQIDPDKEGNAVKRAIRTGLKSVSGAIREQGLDPETHLAELAADFKKLDELGIVLDCDPRRVSDAGLTQERVGSKGGGGGGGAGAGASEGAEDAESAAEE
jgi:lambda family phage portal protein